MSEPFLGEIATYAFNWAPKGYALCDGSILPLGQNTALFSLLGTAFGGNGSTNFALPDLRGRSPLGIGRGPSSGTLYNQGMAAGTEAVTLNITTVPSHTHVLAAATDNGNALAASGNIIATVAPTTPGSHDFSSYMGTGWSADTALNTASVTTAGGSVPHNNMQPYSVVNFCIATSGIYPSRS